MVARNRSRVKRSDERPGWPRPLASGMFGLGQLLVRISMGCQTRRTGCDLLSAGKSAAPECRVPAHEASREFAMPAINMDQ